MFALGQVLPGDVGRNVLGGFASQESVDAFNKEQGLDRPAVTQYLDWASHAVRGDFGKSYTSNESVNSILARALPKSAELALLAFVLMIPLSFLGGLDIGAQGLPARPDRVISIGGLSLTVVPEFVSALVAIVDLRDRARVAARLRPLARRAPTSSSRSSTSCCPRSCSSACSSATSRAWCGPARSRRSTPTTRARRISRALGCERCCSSTCCATRCCPTIAVVATQIGYLLGGLVIVERAFNYPGHGPGDRQPRGAQGLRRSSRRAPW